MVSGRAAAAEAGGGTTPSITVRMSRPFRGCEQLQLRVDIPRLLSVSVDSRRTENAVFTRRRVLWNSSFREPPFVL